MESSSESSSMKTVFSNNFEESGDLIVFDVMKNINNNPQIGKGADIILYNLAFSPKIEYVDLSNNPLSSSETAEAIYKLIKISGSLVTLNLKNTNINNNLSE